MVNLSNCDTEPIHIPGQVQSHGFLLVIDHQNIIRFHSDNAVTYLTDHTIRLLGQHISDVESYLLANEPADFIASIIALGRNKGFEHSNPYAVTVKGSSFNLIIAPSDEFYLLEFEPAISDLNIDIQRVIGRSVSEILADKNLQRLLDNAAQQVRNIIEYDRVMIYRFAEDGHGEVIAEARNEDLESWLGLHYPASDIPQQARELYKKNLTRIIANVHTTPSRISAAPGYDKKPLDLTNSGIRAVSPIHIQYLKNMGVASSFSISLMYKKDLWGLIACHNYTPRFIDYRSRDSSKLIGQILSSALEFRQDEENQQVKQLLKTAVDQLSNDLLRKPTIGEALTSDQINLLNVVDAAGAVLTYDKEVHTLGNVPQQHDLQNLINWIKTHVDGSFFHTSELSKHYPGAEKIASVASGIMVAVLSRELSEYIIWFKPEQTHTITWAGNPEKNIEVDEQGMTHISPRHSFASWSQEISGKSKDWNPEEVLAATRLREEIFYAINQKANSIRELNEKLRQAYDELDTFSFTISHDLKNPLSTIKSYSQILLRNIELEPKGKQIVERIQAGADKMNVMINEVLEYSRLGRAAFKGGRVETEPIISELIKDLLVAYNVPDMEVNVGNTPDIYGDPVMISQVFANLIGNAVKYSLPAEKPTVSIEGRENEGKVIYSVKDNGIGIDNQFLSNVFDLFNRMDNARNIEGSGVGLAIVKRIVDKHDGRIWVESELDKGSTFFVEFDAANSGEER
ncbi:ATP-binding protein [Mucilaginibacter ginkgonis]|nr:ATP-binding protein [Mucilaginibacter ginkgonis]